jgi:hypothetical protein
LKDDSGVLIGVEEVNMPGCITFYEENLVRVEAHYILPEWYALTPLERAIEVCHFRIKKNIEGTILDKREQESKSKNRR